MIAITVLLAITTSTLAELPPKLPSVEPSAAGMNATKLSEIDAVVGDGIKTGQMPGCVVLIAHNGKIAWLKAYGNRREQPAVERMNANTLFDLASLTKPIATATCVMLLVEEGKMRLEDPVAKHLPKFGQRGKEKVTILQLLTHQGGLIADNHLRDYAEGRQEALKKIDALELSYPPGEKFVYSDVGFIALGAMVEKVSGKRMDVLAQERIFTPLGMTETGDLPQIEAGEATLCARAAPTEKRNGQWMKGSVHDPRAFAMDGVAGHAGLFATAEDLAVFAEMLLGKGKYQGVQILEPETVSQLTQRRKTPSGFRTAGWDSLSGDSSNRGSNMSDIAFGHGGFTGTSLWIDPANHLAVIFLSNRLHPDGKGSVNSLAGKIGSIAVDAIE